jgi:hypothetical protein
MDTGAQAKMQGARKCVRETHKTHTSTHMRALVRVPQQEQA